MTADRSARAYDARYRIPGQWYQQQHQNIVPFVRALSISDQTADIRCRHTGFFAYRSLHQTGRLHFGVTVSREREAVSGRETLDETCQTYLTANLRKMSKTGCRKETLGYSGMDGRGHVCAADCCKLCRYSLG